MLIPKVIPAACRYIKPDLHFVASSVLLPSFYHIVLFRMASQYLETRIYQDLKLQHYMHQLQLKCVKTEGVKKNSTKNTALFNYLGQSKFKSGQLMQPFTKSLKCPSDPTLTAFGRNQREFVFPMGSNTAHFARIYPVLIQSIKTDPNN